MEALEILLQFLGELLLQVAAQVLLEITLGAIVGGLILWARPSLSISSRMGRIVSAVVTPMLAGCSMVVLGVWRRRRQEAGVQEGTGIGLMLTKRLVELMGGSLAVSSTPGVGTVFSMELPCAERVAPTPQALAAPALDDSTARDGTRMTILCVEDNLTCP